MSDVYEVILVHADGREEWVPCLDAKELDDGRLAAEVLLGNVIFRKPGRWRKVPAQDAQSLQEIGAEEWLKRRAQVERDEHVRPEIQALVARGNVTPDEIATLRCNSWEWEALVPAMNDDALFERMQHALKNCSRVHRPAASYNESVVGVLAPELLGRFAGWRNIARNCQESLDNVREALGQDETHYLVIADDVKDLVEAIESRCDALVVLKRIRGER